MGKFTDPKDQSQGSHHGERGRGVGKRRRKRENGTCKEIEEKRDERPKCLYCIGKSL